MSGLEERRTILIREIGECEVPAIRQQSPRVLLGESLVSIVMEMDKISGREYRWKAEQYGLGHYIMQQLWKEKEWDDDQGEKCITPKL